MMIVMVILVVVVKCFENIKFTFSVCSVEILRTVQCAQLLTIYLPASFFSFPACVEIYISYW